MAVTDDILATYRGPGRVARRLLAGERHEARALAYLLAGLIVAYVALLPLFYGLAALSRLVARAFGGRGSYFAARIVLFWAFLAATPLMLLRGLVAGLAGPGPGLVAVSVLVFAVFLWFWLAGLAVAEGEGAA